MPTVEQQRRAGRTQQATAATVRATVDDQVKAVSAATDRNRTDLEDKVGRMAAALQQRPDQLAELDRLRLDQERQLGKVNDQKVAVLDALRDAADELDRRQRREVARCPDDPRAREKLADRHRQEAGELARLRQSATEELRALDDRQQLMLADQRKAFRLRSADGTLVQQADALADKRAADERRIQQQAAELADRVRRQLAGDANADQPAAAPAGTTRRRTGRLDVGRAMWETFTDQLGPLSEAEKARIQRETLARDPRVDPLRQLVDQIGERAAQILTGGEPKHAALKERFTAACRVGDDRLAGVAFHKAAEEAAKELKGRVPPGWRMEAELRLPDSKGALDSRLDILFHRPGEAVNFDWKTTGRSALGAVNEMKRHEERARDYVARQTGIHPAEVAFQQESRSWTDYVRGAVAAREATERTQRRVEPDEP